MAIHSSELYRGVRPRSERCELLLGAEARAITAVGSGGRTADGAQGGTRGGSG